MKLLFATFFSAVCKMTTSIDNVASKICLFIYLYLVGISVLATSFGLPLGVQLLQSFQLQEALPPNPLT